MEGLTDSQVEEKKAVIHTANLPKMKVIPFQIQQLFINLLGNSIKYSKPDVAPEIKIDYEKASFEKVGNVNECQFSLPSPVFAQNLQFQCIIGILDFERTQEQDVIVDARIHYKYENEFIDYALLCDLFN